METGLIVLMFWQEYDKNVLWNSNIELFPNNKKISIDAENNDYEIILLKQTIFINNIIYCFFFFVYVHTIYIHCCMVILFAHIAITPTLQVGEVTVVAGGVFFVFSKVS